MAEFKFIKPVSITDLMETSSNLAILKSLYNAGTTYDLDDEIYYGTYVYKSLQGSNTGNTPGSGIWWQEVEKINTLRYRDGKIGTYSERTSNVTIGITPSDGVALYDGGEKSQFDSVSLFGIVADTLNINVVADARVSQLKNSDFGLSLYGWSDNSVGTDEVDWDFGTCVLTYTDASNYAGISQTISGTVDKKRVIYIEKSSTANLVVKVNGVTLLSGALPANFAETFVSDGSDYVEIYGNSVVTSFVEYVYIKEVSEENLILNGGFEDNITSWTDGSIGTGTWTWDAGQFGKLVRTDINNRGIATQAVTGTRGEKQKYVVKNDSTSTGDLRVAVNGVNILTLTPGTEDEAIIISDGSEAIALFNNTDASIVYVDYVIQTLYTQYDETIDLSNTLQTTDSLLSNSYFNTDIDNWDDLSIGTGTFTWDSLKYGKLVRVDSSNYGKGGQTVSGTSGAKQKYTVKVGSNSTGSLAFSINSIAMTPIAAGDEVAFVVESDGNDGVTFWPQSDGTTVYVDYIVQKLYVPYPNGSNLSTIVRTGLTNTDGILTVTLDKLFATVQLGELVLGEATTFGSFRSAGVTMKSYATKSTDTDTDVTTFTPGDYARIIDYRVAVEVADVEDSMQFLEDNGNTAVVAVGDLEFPQTIVYGFLSGFYADLNGTNKNNFTIKIEELT